MAAENQSSLRKLVSWPNPAVNADVPDTFVLLVSRCGGTPVTLYRQAAETSRTRNVVISIRPAKAADATFIEETFLEALRESIAEARGVWDERRERRQFNDQLQLQHSYIIQRSDTNVGFFMLVPDAAALALHTLCVAPAYQGKGIGSEVMYGIIDNARQSDVALTLSVLKANRRARAFYERLHFAVVAESTHHYQFQHAASAA